MPSHVQNSMQSPAPGKSSVAKQQSNRAFDLGASESRFADTLKRARTDESKPERTETGGSTATQKPRAGKTRKSDRADKSTDETEPLDSTVSAERSRKGEAKPTDEVTDVIEGETAFAQEEGAPAAEEKNGNENSLLTPDEMLLAAQMATVSVPTNEIADAVVDVAEGETATALTTKPPVASVVTPVQDKLSKAPDAEAVDDVGLVTAEGEGELLASLGLEDVTDAAEDLTAPRANTAVATPMAEKSTNSKPQSRPTVVDEALAADAPAETETENAVKPVQANLGSQSGDADPQFDLAQQSANPIDAKTTPVTTTAPPTAEVTVAPAPVAVAASHTATLPAAPPTQITVPDFAETNHDKIVTSLRSTAFDKGGIMEIRLDPPELGALQVSVKMQDGVMTASFLTSNDEATRLLSHSLGQLKHVLESAGVTVDKLQVQQSPKNDNDTNSDGRHHSERDDSSARQEQQRKEMIKRMWSKLSGVSDPLDLVA